MKKKSNSKSSKQSKSKKMVETPSSKPNYLVVTDGLSIYIKEEKDLLDTERVYKDTKNLTRLMKENLYNCLPPLPEGKEYYLMQGKVKEKKSYPKERKKRSKHNFQVSRGKKIEKLIKEEVGSKGMTVGDKMRILRMKHGYTIRELASITGVHYLTIHQLENSSVLTTRDRFESICLGLDISFGKMVELYTDLTLEFIKKRGKAYDRRSK